MIIGIGNDLIDIRRVEKLLVRFGDKFSQKVFTEHEINKAKGEASSLAKRFAAKEAVAKALATGIGKNAAWQEIEVKNLPSGQPIIFLHGNAKQTLQNLIPKDYNAKIHLSLSDEYPYAQAFVVISAEIREKNLLC